MKENDHENQLVEWKESWRDDYLKWVCGFANAQGGTLIIGKDDHGNIRHLKNAKKLLELIPNKVRDILGLTVDIKHNISDGKEFLEIRIESCPYPISFRGKYYYRSGSTLQELKGNALNKFLLQKQGKKWDAVPVPELSIDQLKQETLEFFKDKAIKSKRLDTDDLSSTPKELLQRLHLFADDSPWLKRAAVLLFHPTPENFFSGAYIKIGFFEDEAKLLFQDEIHGNLLEQAEKSFDLLQSKYNRAIISYHDGIREENYYFPLEAIREALYNAIAHKDYSSAVPIQIRVYPDKIIFWNAGHLPENWTVERLLQIHPSIPFNPDLANTFFRAGYIEAWGKGTLNIIQSCIHKQMPAPVFSILPSEFQLELIRHSHASLSKSGLKEEMIKIILFVQENGSISNSEVQALCKVSKATATRYLNELEKEWIEKEGSTGVGTIYRLKGLSKGSKKS